MRNWNRKTSYSNTSFKISFYSTYEELKPLTYKENMSDYKSFYSTYEELKLLHIQYNYSIEY